MLITHPPNIQALVAGWAVYGCFLPGEPISGGVRAASATQVGVLTRASAIVTMIILMELDWVWKNADWDKTWISK